MSEESQALDTLVDQFLTYLQYRKNATSTTIATYRSTLHFFVQFTDNCKVNDLSVKMVDDYANSLIVFNYKPKTYRNKLAPIRSFFRYLYIKDITDIRPEKIEVPGEGVHEANFLDEEEQNALINACETPKERAVILMLLRSGLRVSELIDARKDDLYRRSLVVRHGKGRKSRVTFITEDAELAVKAFHRTLHDQKYLIPNVMGGQISRQYISRIVSDCAVRAGIKKRVSSHTLRHTFATNLLRNGARAEDVQPMMGHSNIRTTLIYTHFTNEYLHSRYDLAMENTAVL